MLFNLTKFSSLIHTHTHLFNGPFSGTTRVNQYQKGKPNLELDFTEARDSEWQWYQLGHMQVCTLLQTDNHASTPPLSFFTGRMPFLPPNQQLQSTEGRSTEGSTYLPTYLLIAVTKTCRNMFVKHDQFKQFSQHYRDRRVTIN